MMSLSIGYPQILASGYPYGKFTIRFSPNFYHELALTIYSCVQEAIHHLQRHLFAC